MKHNPIHYEREKQYPLSVAEAWRLLADTDHLNRSIGLPPIDFSPMDGANLQFIRSAKARTFGVVPLRWREYPFDWIREKRYAVRREFENGPVAVLVGGMELQPKPDGVVVRAFADFTPANVTGRVLWRFGTPVVRDMLTFTDHYLERKTAGVTDPTPVPRASVEVDGRLLERGIQQLGRSPVDASFIPRLRDRILHGSDDQLARLRPYPLADAWGADRFEVLRLFLHATRAGLFELRWELMCPNCRVAKGEASTLSDVPARFHCDTCGIDYGTDLDQRVELRFTVHPALRQVVDKTYCVGGPLRMPHVLAQQFLQAGESRSVEVQAQEPLRLRAVGSSENLTLVSRPDSRSRGALAGGEVKLSYAEGRWVGPHSLAFDDKGVLGLPEGAVLVLRNQTNGPLLAVVEDLDWGGDATTVAQMSTLQEFRELFSTEVLSPGQELAVRDVTLMFSDLEGSTALYERVGDATAYSRVNRHFDLVRMHIEEHHGAVVKTMGDGLMASFARLEDGARAALAIQRGLKDWCEVEGISPPLRLRVGLHHGAAIVMNANDRLDYFGRSANIAARLGGQAQAGEVVVLDEVLREIREVMPGEMDALEVELFRANLRGLPGAQDLARLRAGTTSMLAP
jgi:class 3 adenylate cyclase